MKKCLALVLFLQALLSCNLVYHPDEIRPNAKHLNADNIEKIKALSPKSSFKFILTGDTQRFYDELDDFIDHVNARDDISFVLLNGDLVDFGLNREYNWVAQKLERLKVPFIAAIGNHDMLANGRLIFREMFGPENFSFQYGDNRFICLNTNSREVGLDGSVPDIPWLNDQLADTSVRNIFILSHVAPFSIDFDLKLEHGFRNALWSNPKVRMSLHGHEHHYFVERGYQPGVTYLLAGAGNQRNYALIAVNGKEYQFQENFY